MLRRAILAMSGASAFVIAFLASPDPLKPVDICRKQKSEGDAIYPREDLSPLESLRGHDVVFWGEVSVPVRACSLGFCAGIEVLKVIKGKLPRKVLMQVALPPGSRCQVSLFSEQKAKWLVFANKGTSRTGYEYWQAAEDGPSFKSQMLPNLAVLDFQFQSLRAQLDAAINERLGTRQ